MFSTVILNDTRILTSVGWSAYWSISNFCFTLGFRNRTVSIAMQKMTRTWDRNNIHVRQLCRQ